MKSRYPGGRPGLRLFLKEATAAKIGNETGNLEVRKQEPEEF
jgi:hypothetical protein